MLSGFDTASALRAGVGDRQRTWAFVRDFAASWTRPIVSGDGFDVSEVDGAGRRVGVALPVALREAYLLFGRRDDLTRHQDRLLPPERLHLDESGEVLVFREENQHCAWWGVPLADAAHPDPPVVFGRYGTGWQPFLDRVSLACVEMVLTEVMFAAPGHGAQAPADLISLIEANYQRINLPDYPNWAGADASPLRWYSRPGQLLRVDGVAPDAWLFTGAMTPAHLRALHETVPAIWE